MLQTCLYVVPNETLAIWKAINKTNMKVIDPQFDGSSLVQRLLRRCASFIVFVFAENRARQRNPYVKVFAEHCAYALLNWAFDIADLRL